jgi:hypothetical protein
MVLQRTIEQQARKCLVLGPAFQNLGRNARKNLQIIAARAEPFAHTLARRGGRDLAFDDRPVKLVLGCKMPENKSFSHTCLLGNLLRGGALESLPGEKLCRRLQNLLPAVGR